MSAAKYAPPPEQLRSRLEVARGKRTPFRIAFNHALRHIDYPHDRDSEQAWKHALKDTRAEWEAAYLREPPVVPGMATVVSMQAA